MSVVLVIGSEEQLTTGLMWCQTFGESLRRSVAIVVVGTDHRVLLEHARRRLAATLDLPSDQVTVVGVEDAVEAMLNQLRSIGCSVLAMVYNESLEKLQRQLFEHSRAPVFWLQASGPPPTSPGRLFAAMSQSNLSTATASEKLFGFAPAAVLPDPFVDAEESIQEIVERVTAKINADATQTGDLVLIGIGEATSDNRIYAVGLKLLENQCAASVALIHDGDSLKDSLGSRIQDWFRAVAPSMARDQRLELAQDLEINSKPNLEFLGLMSAAAMLAAFGLLQNSAAVIIGAMLIAPLMTPIVGAGLALSLGNRPLFKGALLTIALGFSGALIASILFGLLVRLLHQVMGIDLGIEIGSTPEMWARCRPSPLDFCVGMVGGLAASYARTRRHLSSALAGAAIAAALVPPIATAGLQVAFGQWERQPSGETPVIGPLLLVCVNVLTIMVGSSFILWARGMRSDRKLSGKERWAPRMTAVLLLLSLLVLVGLIT